MKTETRNNEPLRSTKSRSLSGLFGRLAEGWSESQPGLALELVQVWRDSFQSGTEVKEVGEGLAYFTTDVSEICLRGCDDLHCLLLARPESEALAAVQEFRRRAAAPGRLLVILSCREDAFRAVKSLIGQGLCLVLSPAEALTLLETPSVHYFKKLLRWKVPLRALIPYNSLRPALGNLFVGRHAELHRLIQEEEVSWAIAGPGRIGKTSLAKEYRRRLIQSHDPRVPRLVEIDFYPCGDTSSQGVARFFAMGTESSSRSDRMTADGLVDFLRYQRAKRGGPLELLLDEVDEVCRGIAFDRIGEAARLGLCRLILCGRGELLGMMLSQSAPLACRVELLRPAPLEETEARDLIVRPLTDLGLTVEEPQRLMDRLYRLTGRLPHLLQLYGKSLAERAIDENASRISLSAVDSLDCNFEIAQHVTSPLAELDDPEERFLALSLLKELPGEIAVAAAQALVTRYGFVLSQHRTLEILNRLVVANILSWRRGRFGIANEALRSYAEVLGFLDTGLEEARLAFLARQAMRAGGGA
jgi:hypothetical protein